MQTKSTPVMVCVAVVIALLGCLRVERSRRESLERSAAAAGAVCNLSPVRPGWQRTGETLWSRAVLRAHAKQFPRADDGRADGRGRRTGDRWSERSARRHHAQVND